MSLHSTERVEAMLKATGGVPVIYGGRTTWGHFDHVPASFGEEVSVVTSLPSVVIASGALPEICLDDGAGSVGGINERLTVDDHDWFVRALEPGESPGELRVLLSNRPTSG